MQEGKTGRLKIFTDFLVSLAGKFSSTEYIKAFRELIHKNKYRREIAMKRIVNNILLICLMAIGMVLFASIDVYAAESQVIPDYEDGMSASVPIGNYQYWISKNKIVKHDLRIDDIDKRERDAAVVVKLNENEIMVCAMIHDKTIFYATKTVSGVERTVYQYDFFCFKSYW